MRRGAEEEQADDVFKRQQQNINGPFSTIPAPTPTVPLSSATMMSAVRDECAPMLSLLGALDMGPQAVGIDAAALLSHAMSSYD